MSYSVDQKCRRCKKEPSCADGMIIRKAVDMIHDLPSRYEGGERIGGHLGGGTIVHDCRYGFEEKNEVPGPAQPPISDAARNMHG